MNKDSRKSGIPVFGQLLSFISKNSFNRLVAELHADRYVKKFSSWDHLVTMLFAVIQDVKGLRELSSGMACHNQYLKHLGMGCIPAKSTLSDANSRRSADLFENLFQCIYSKNRDFFSDSSLSRNEKWLSKLFLVDSTTITLFKNIMKACGNPMANGRRKGGVKIHTGMWLTEQVPSLIRITKASSSDKKFMFDFKNMNKGTILVFDKAYVNFELFNHWSKDEVSFVTRLHYRLVVTTLANRQLSEDDKKYGIIDDHDSELGHKAQKEKVQCRIIKFYDSKQKRQIEFVTNNMELAAWEVAEIYKQRWQIEILFKRLKQNIKITSFLGDNENAIRIQIWCALISDLLINIARKAINKGKMAYSVVCGLTRLHLMQYVQIRDLLNKPADPTIFYKTTPEIDLFTNSPP
jgi:hypothetical protein